MDGFWQNRRVFVTGHTGFKGSWLTRMLVGFGAEVTGYALAPTSDFTLFSLADVEKRIRHVVGDIRDFQRLEATFREAEPEIVFHLAAQPIVREGYNDPRRTYETNVMGTVNLLECARTVGRVKSLLNVTTDKVYLNDERGVAFKEDAPLDGYDPYSNSKSCSELVTHAYMRSFFVAGEIAISTARAGNVIGGGDFSVDRIIPDCIRAIKEARNIIVRNPESVRPYQHVLDSLAAYLDIAKAQYFDPALSGCYNVGPDECDCVTTGALVEMFCKEWGREIKWQCQAEATAPHEAGSLRLDGSKLKSALGWKPRWHIGEAVRKTCEFAKVWMEGGDVSCEMDREISEFYS